MTSVNLKNAAWTASADTSEQGLSHTAAAYGISAAIAVLFNTGLAWVKDSYEPLNTAMAKLTGHHWTTHGLAVVIVFLGLGFILSSRQGELFKDVYTPVTALVSAVVIAGLGLVGWFLFL